MNPKTDCQIFVFCYDKLIFKWRANEIGMPQIPAEKNNVMKKFLFCRNGAEANGNTHHYSGFYSKKLEFQPKILKSEWTPKEKTLP